MSIRRSAPWMGALLLSASIATAQEAPTLEEMWAIVQQQQAEIEALRGELAEARAGMEVTEEKVAETDAKVEATGDVIETLVANSSSSTRWPAMASRARSSSSRLTSSTGLAITPMHARACSCCRSA